MRTIKAIQKELNENKELAKASGLLQDEKDFILGEIKDLEKELEEAEKAVGSSKSSVKKEKTQRKSAKSASKPKTPKPPKEKKFVMVGDKKITEDDPKFCEVIIDQWKARREAIKKAAGKRKTKSVIQRAASDVADAVSKGVRNFKIDEIKKDPKKAIAKMERLEKAGKEFIESYKDILGEKITQAEIKQEFEGLDKVIKQISDKYLKEKMRNGGSVFSDYPIYKKRDGQDWKLETTIYASSFDEAKKEFAKLMTDKNWSVSNNVVWLNPNDEDNQYKIREEGWYDLDSTDRNGNPELIKSKEDIEQGFDSFSEDVYSWELREVEEN